MRLSSLPKPSHTVRVDARRVARPPPLTRTNAGGAFGDWFSFAKPKAEQNSSAVAEVDPDYTVGDDHAPSSPSPPSSSNNIMPFVTSPRRDYLEARQASGQSMLSLIQFSNCMHL